MPAHPLCGPAHAGIPEHGRVPRYFDVKVRLELLLDELGAGGRLPAERELAERFAVSRVTLRQALRELQVQGRLLRRGRRVVVAGRAAGAAGGKIEQPLALVAYAPGGEQRQLERRSAGRELGEQLRIPAADEVWHIRRVLLVDDEPVGLESRYLPCARFPDPTRGLAPELRAARADERIETVLASPHEGQLLRTRPGLPMLLLHRRCYDRTGEPVEQVRSLFRGDRFTFTTRLGRERHEE